MAWLSITVALIAGFGLGLAVAFALRLVQARTAKELADALLRESESQRRTDVEAVVDAVKASFASMSLEALGKSTDELLKMAKSSLGSEREMTVKELDAKKGLIDQQLTRMTLELEKVSKLMQDLESDRAEKFGELASNLKTASKQTAALLESTNVLREALASSKTRGAWGQRMAEDVLRVAGFVENVNYLKEKTIPGVGSRPDFTFLLPRGLRLNMDVKFPFDNYVKYLEAGTHTEKETFRKKFLKDVKGRFKEVTTREYINPVQNTVDYVLLFIPNEQIYAFIHEQDSTILDEGIRNKVVLCSPVTLFAVLAVIRQAVDNFALEQTSNEIVSLLGTFNKNWKNFVQSLEKMGRRISDAQKEFEILVSTRRRQLEKPLNKIEDIRRQRRLPLAPTEEDSGFLAIDGNDDELAGNVRNSSLE